MMGGGQTVVVTQQPSYGGGYQTAYAPPQNAFVGQPVSLGGSGGGYNNTGNYGYG